MRSNLSTAALVLSILSLCCCGLPCGIAGLILTIMARREEGEFTAKTVVSLVFSILGLLSAVASGIYSFLFYEEFMREFERAFSEAGAIRLTPARLL